MKIPKVFYRRSLPHIHPPGGTFFITYLLHGAIPKPLLEKLKRDHKLKVNELRIRGTEAAIDDEQKRSLEDLTRLSTTLKVVHSGLRIRKFQKL